MSIRPIIAGLTLVSNLPDPATRIGWTFEGDSVGDDDGKFFASGTFTKATLIEDIASQMKF